MECKLEILFLKNIVHTDRCLPYKTQVIWTTFPRDISTFRHIYDQLGFLVNQGFRVQSLTQTAWIFEIIFFLTFSIGKNFKKLDSRSSDRFPLKTYLPWFKIFFTKTQKFYSFLVQMTWNRYQNDRIEIPYKMVGHLTKMSWSLSLLCISKETILLTSFSTRLCCNRLAQQHLWIYSSGIYPWCKQTVRTRSYPRPFSSGNLFSPLYQRKSKRLLYNKNKVKNFDCVSRKKYAP